jgi:hypothetical protein
VTSRHPTSIALALPAAILISVLLARIQPRLHGPSNAVTVAVAVREIARCLREIGEVRVPRVAGRQFCPP